MATRPHSTAAQLRRLARERLTDASVLHKAGRHDGAVYLCGYAVELSLKARISTTLKWATFPPTGLGGDAFKSFKVHNLDVLLLLSGRETRVKRASLTDWTIVAKWDPEARYDPAATATPAEAADMILAATNLMRAL